MQAYSIHDMSCPCRMVAAVRAAPAAQSSEGNAVRALVDVIRREETAVTVNLDDRIQVCLLIIFVKDGMLRPCVNARQSHWQVCQKRVTPRPSRLTS